MCSLPTRRPLAVPAAPLSRALGRRALGHRAGHLPSLPLHLGHLFLIIVEAVSGILLYYSLYFHISYKCLIMISKKKRKIDCNKIRGVFLALFFKILLFGAIKVSACVYSEHLAYITGF